MTPEPESEGPLRFLTPPQRVELIPRVRARLVAMDAADIEFFLREFGIARAPILTRVGEH